MSLYAEDIEALAAAGWRQAVDNPPIWESPGRKNWIDTRWRDWRERFARFDLHSPAPAGEGPGVREP
ncbi:MAG: hypothetical protein AB7T37_07745 [Dehalococcoidia bacterium]